jgi:hypothetical protein
MGGIAASQRYAATFVMYMFASGFFHGACVPAGS